ncbi:hypothetical protein TNCV_657751 [Trichonephila clavipes]|uniref:Uncharacterized protein n=1 Tax=Trichonephila clavipes TaxID=2585209 RepID=A0A8X6VG51_TRICX|nr:hypothetical protein TNCV_657751 [Trichonephila clavipes]
MTEAPREKTLMVSYPKTNKACPRILTPISCCCRLPDCLGKLLVVNYVPLCGRSVPVTALRATWGRSRRKPYVADPAVFQS